MQWNRLYRTLLILVLLVLGAGACTDLAGPVELTSGGGAEVRRVDPAYACDTTVDGVYVMCPVTPAPSVPTCDPWASLDWCGGDGSCQMSSPTTGGPESVSAMGCETGGDGGGVGGPGMVGPGGGGGEVGTGSSFTGPAAEGPLAWGACVLGVLGSGYSIDQVAGAFESWWSTQREYESARRMLDALQANPESTTPEMMSLWEFRVEYHQNRRDDALAAVHEKVGGSYWALVGAAAACGIAAFLPIP